VRERTEKRTLTNLYNTRPTWLDLAHRKLDETVFQAYGWPSDLTDDGWLGLAAPTCGGVAGAGGNSKTMRVGER
jgi:hypothetical protein